MPRLRGRDLDITDMRNRSRKCQCDICPPGPFDRREIRPHETHKLIFIDVVVDRKPDDRAVGRADLGGPIAGKQAVALAAVRIDVAAGKIFGPTPDFEHKTQLENGGSYCLCL